MELVTLYRKEVFHKTLSRLLPTTRAIPNHRSISPTFVAETEQWLVITLLVGSERVNSTQSMIECHIFLDK